MKKFIFSLTVLISGVLMLCSTLIAEGLVVGGYNASGKTYATSMFSFDGSITSIIFLVISFLIIITGLILSILSIKEKDNK